MGLVTGVNYYTNYYNQKKHQTTGETPDSKYYESINKKAA